MPVIIANNFYCVSGGSVYANEQRNQLFPDVTREILVKYSKTSKFNEYFCTYFI